MGDKRFLVAGIGNIFLGDDAFGVEVVRQLQEQPLPDAVWVKDFGIRSYDLAYALLENYEAAILVDATQRGGTPGTLYLIKPDLDALGPLDGEVVNAHSLNPVRVLHMVKSMGGEPRQLYVLGCEPAVLEAENGVLGLSKPVALAVPEAVTMIRSLVRQWLVSC